jgi:transcriptional repressor NrdR
MESYMLFVHQILIMNNRRSTNAFNKRKTKTSDPRKNTKSISKSTSKRSRIKDRRSNFNSRKMSQKRNLNSNYKKRAANRQSTVLTIRRSSGRKEKFNMERMAQTVSRSGVPFLMARDISKKIAKEVKNTSITPPQQGRHKKSTEKQRKMPRKPRIIPAGKVRQMVAEELIDRNRPDIAKSYSGEPALNTAQHIDDSLIEKQRGIDKSSLKTQHSRRNEVMHDQSKRGGGTMT